MEDSLRWKTTDGGREIMGEVSLQKSFPYSGRMCYLLRGDVKKKTSIFKDIIKIEADPLPPTLILTNYFLTKC